MRDLRTVLRGVVAIMIAVPGVTACSSGGGGGGGNCSTTTVTVSAAAACEIGGFGSTTYDEATNACNTACGASYEGDCGLSWGDGGFTQYAGQEMGNAHAVKCPFSESEVQVTCGGYCLGRRTDGTRELVRTPRVDIGAYLAECAYLEEVSVHAFTRLAMELEAFGAPRELVDDALRAREDEVRHSQRTADLARSFGHEPERAVAPEFPARGLFAIALENAVEGCVRETYGAAVALVGAEKATLVEMRELLGSLAEDECRHADLSWRVADWALPRLDADERARVQDAMRAARMDLANVEDGVAPEARVACGVPSREERQRVLTLLDARLFQQAA